MKILLLVILICVIVLVLDVVFILILYHAFCDNTNYGIKPGEYEEFIEWCKKTKQE